MQCFRDTIWNAGQKQEVEMNVVMLSGSIKEPMSKKTEKSHMTRFTLITTTEWTRNGRTNTYQDYHRVVVWGQASEYLEGKLHDGDLAVVRGELRNRKYTDKDGNERRVTEVIINNNGGVEILSQK